VAPGDPGTPVVWTCALSKGADANINIPATNEAIDFPFIRVSFKVNF
jgi:hypothetical protein